MAGLFSFDKELAEFRSLLRGVINRQNTLQETMDQILEKVMCNELTVKQTESKFDACAKGFYQVREACTCLVEKLDEVGGTITEQTWLD
jgi:hypothetical protein